MNQIFTLSLKYKFNFMELIAGVDEAGRGPLAGPVIACAVILPNDHTIEGLKDSKKLSKTKREKLYPIIYEEAISVGIGRSSVELIDKINIREATFNAMKIALKNLKPKPTKALIDGHSLPDQKIPNKGIVGGDDLIDSIKAASIIAKVTRDNIMKEYSIIFPEYGFEKHSGYGTKIHKDALKKYKATPIHRRTFKPVKSQMPTLNWLSKNNKINWLGEKLASLFLIKEGEKIFNLLNGNEFSSQVNIEGQRLKKKVFIKVLTNYYNFENSINNNLINDSINNFKLSIDKKGKLEYEAGKCRFGHVFVGLKKGGPVILYKKDIYLD